MDGEEARKLESACAGVFELLDKAIHVPGQLDALKCPPEALPLLAWAAGINRIKNEPDESFRRRIYFAYANAKDAGSNAGLKRIFERLAVGLVEIQERLPGYDWDMVHVSVTDEQLANIPGLIDAVLAQYGKTCRRYTIQAMDVATCYLGVTHVDHNMDMDVAISHAI